MDINFETPATEIIKMPGVVDLPSKSRMHFALALKNEAAGDHAKANEQLLKAIEAEHAERNPPGVEAIPAALTI